MGIVEDTVDLVAFVSATLKAQTQKLLCDSGISSEILDGIEEVFESPITRPFEGLESFHKQLQYYCKHFNFIVSYCMAGVYNVLCVNDEL